MSRTQRYRNILFTVHCEATLPDGRYVTEITHRKTEAEALEEIAAFKKRYTQTKTYYDYEYSVEGRVTIT